MKKSCFLFAVVLVMNIYAHPYQCMYSHRKAYFSTDNLRIETLSMDSCVFVNDSILYPSRTVQLIGDECYDPYGGSWAGKKVIINNQWNFFFNDDNDTIKIKVDAGLNESWMLFQRADNSITATVTKWDTATVVGVVDSVKVLTLHVLDKFMQPIAHELENVTIALSKHHGMTKSLNFTYFPSLKFNAYFPVAKEYSLMGITHPTLGTQSLKWLDVFDFQVGDEFHYIASENTLMLGGSAFERKHIVRILTREDVGHSIRYTQDIQAIKRFKQDAQTDYVISSEHYRDTVQIYENAAFDQEPGIPVFNTDSSRLWMYLHFNAVHTIEIYYKDNGCWVSENVIDDACHGESYANGRGLIALSSGCWPWQSYYMEDQVYFKKGLTSWGTPLLLTNNEDLNDRLGIIIHSNPITNELYIDLNDGQHGSFELFDLQGKSVIQKELNLQRNSVSMQHLNKGMYLYRITMDDQQSKVGKFLKSHTHEN